jgi:signal transduction histidine kinase
MSQDHFSMVLASTVHDIKNALSIIAQELGEMVNEASDETGRIALLQHEVNRMNGMLVQLLTLYKHDQKQLPVQMALHDVHDFLQEQLYAFQTPLKHSDVSLILEVEDELEWYFDESLVGVMISNIIGNTIRYAKSSIHLSASEINGSLVIKVQDDGNGFPEQMLEQQNQVILGVSSGHSKTGLGIYFSKLIANLHGYEDKTGTIKLSNNAQGGCFTIQLP